MTEDRDIPWNNPRGETAWFAEGVDPNVLYGGQWWPVQRGAVHNVSDKDLSSIVRLFEYAAEKKVNVTLPPESAGLVARHLHRLGHEAGSRPL